MESNGHRMRSDWPLIKHLSKTYGNAVGEAWQRLPVIDLESGDFLRRFMQGTSARQLPHLVFDDMLLSFAPDVLFTPGARDEQPKRLVARVTSTEHWKRAKTESPWLQGTGRGSNGQLSAEGTGDMEVWIADHRGQSTLALQLCTAAPASDKMEIGLHLIRCDYAEDDALVRTVLRPGELCLWALEEGRGICRTVGCPIREDDGTTHCPLMWWNNSMNLLVLRAVAYLAQCPEYLVEVTPAPTNGDKRQARNPKPWTNEHLPRIILMNPKAAAPVTEEPHRGGTHRSPRPHQKRGHWRNLRHEKYRRNDDGTTRKVFVKPAWVGPREWVTEGAHYRVIDTDESRTPAPSPHSAGIGSG